MKITLLSVVAFLSLALTSASADTITFDFSTATGTSNTATFTGSDGVTMISATSGVSGPNLLFKNGGGFETGLGLSGTNQNEINPGQTITFDLSSLVSAHDSVSIALGSIQTGESGQVCGSGGCITVTSSQNGQLIDITSLLGSSGSISITAPAGNILVDELQATTVPEPNSLMLLGTGVFAMAGAFRKKFFN